MSGSETYLVQITAAGEDYYLPYEDHEWAIQSGYHAPIQAWLCPAETATTIMSALSGLTGTAREVTLKLGDPADPVSVERVIVVGTAPADDVRKRYLLLADVRWYLTRAWFVMDVNVRRRLGDTRLLGNVLTGTSIADTVAYAPWSLDDTDAYDWATLKQQTLDALTSARHGRPAIAWTTDSFVVLDYGTFSAQIVQQSASDARSDLALARMIEALPGAGIYVSLDGKIHVFETTPGAETDTVEALPPALMGHGDLVLVDRSCFRPAASEHAFRVYFDLEVEVRCTFNYVTADDVFSDFPDDPWLIQVVQVTDRTLFIPGGTYTGLGTVAARWVGQGSWITLEEAFAAWGSATYGTIDLPVLDDDIVARHWFDDSLDSYAMGETLDTFDPLWQNRIDELMHCYRTVFRINPAFWERVRHAWAVRAAIWDPATGQRAPAPVYQNFNMIPVNRFVSGSIPELGVNVTDSYDDTTGLLENGRPSGFGVKLLDEELGIVMIDRNALSKYPGNAKINISPVQQAAKINLTALDAVGEVTAQELVLARSGAAPWKLSIVLSLAPSSPNDMRRLYEVQVSIADAAAYIGLDDVPSTNSGPDMELRTHMAEARVAWQDDLTVSRPILKVFGITDTEAPDIGDDDPVTDLVPINLVQELQPLAKSLAAAYLLSHLDRYEGARAVPIDAELVPIGSITRVVHKVTKNRAVTVVHCEAGAPSFDAVDFLQGSARSYLLQEIATRR